MAEFTFAPEGSRTAVTWSLAGRQRFVVKAVALVMDTDTMIGETFDEGLARMKSIVERGGSPPAFH